jgi:hypothetical protein
VRCYGRARDLASRASDEPLMQRLNRRLAALQSNDAGDSRA